MQEKKFQMLGVANSDFTPIGIPEKYISCDFSAGSSMGTILGAVVGRPIAEIFLLLLECSCRML